MSQAGNQLLINGRNILKHQIVVEMPVDTLDFVFNARCSGQKSADTGEGKRSAASQCNGHI
ncbi:hypothetical protein GCM10011328_26700 [Hafnia psychrotolerans]|uniref:Uncharacterized protein n=1 Tax=Hafnia psychrotolerans TaxID=1477018 RepID=A0ABQ1GUG1_9GAMM|nr:hypothetical protein GCM10011328_26700 [Hafnia psychrotolerans]